MPEKRRKRQDLASRHRWRPGPCHLPLVDQQRPPT
uniref:Uncharacterized protein n=1 Tax=Arundo donax TaxID=35708 RepID=A0A0A8ZKG7_ARUDO